MYNLTSAVCILWCACMYGGLNNRKRDKIKQDKLFI